MDSKQHTPGNHTTLLGEEVPPLSPLLAESEVREAQVCSHDRTLMEEALRRSPIERLLHAQRVLAATFELRKAKRSAQ